VAGPPEDFNNERTRYRDVGNHGGPPANEPPPPGEPPPPAGDPQLDPFGEDAEPIAWYRRPVVLIVWALTVLILIGLIVFGITQLVGDQGTTTNPKTTTTTPTTTSTTTTTPSTTSTTPTTTPTTTETTVPTESSQRPEPQPTQQPTRQEPTRRHHWPSWLPTTVPAIP
jgi:cell division septation protein DedD